MKKILSIICILILLFGCNNKLEFMILKPNNNIPNIVLEHYDNLSNPLFYDFTVNNEIVSFELIQYQLIDGEWINRFCFVGSNFNEEKGAFSLNPDVYSQYMKITTLYGDIKKGDLVSFQGIDNNNPEYLNKRFKYISLDEFVEIEYGKEIPILIQIETNNELTQRFNINIDKLSDQFKDYEENVYLITILFNNQYIK